jgi:hypothetical protein
MRRTIQILAALILMATLATWAAKGANRGWTKTSVAVKTTDPVTGIDAITYEKRFLPGVDFLGGGLVLAAVLGGVSFLYKRPLAKA